MRIKGILNDFQPRFWDDLPSTYKKVYNPPPKSTWIFIEYQKKKSCDIEIFYTFVS